MYANLLFITSDKNYPCNYFEENDDIYLGRICADYIDGSRTDQIENTIADKFGGAATFRRYESEQDGIVGELSFDDVKLIKWAKERIEAFKVSVSRIPTDGKWNETYHEFFFALDDASVSLFTSEPVYFDGSCVTPLAFAIDYLSNHPGQPMYVCDCVSYHC